MSLDNSEEIKELERIKSQIDLALSMLRDGSYIRTWGNYPERTRYFDNHGDGGPILIGDYCITKR